MSDHDRLPDDPAGSAANQIARATYQTGAVDTPSPSPPVFEPIEQSRDLTDAEMRAARTLALAAGSELLAQLDEATVTGLCRCGCSSVQLATTSPPVTAKWLLSHSSRGREDYLAISAVAERADDRLITVTLHVVKGRVTELELFDTVLGEGHPIDLSALQMGPPALE